MRRGRAPFLLSGLASLLIPQLRALCHGRISTSRLTQGNAEARKAALEEEARFATKEATAARMAMRDEITAINEVSHRPGGAGCLRLSL